MTVSGKTAKRNFLFLKHDVMKHVVARHAVQHDGIMCLLCSADIFINLFWRRRITRKLVKILELYTRKMESKIRYLYQIILSLTGYPLSQNNGLQ